MELTTTFEFLADQTSKFIENKTSSLFDHIVGNMTSSYTPLPTSDDNATATIHSSGFYPNGDDAEMSGFGPNMTTDLLDFSTQGPPRSQYTDTMGDEFSFTTAHVSANDYIMCTESQKLDNDCKNDGVCVARMEGEVWRSMCKCDSGFSGERCEFKYNDLFFAYKEMTMMTTWIPWSISIILALAICLLLVLLICFMRRHRTHTSAESGTDPEKGRRGNPVNNGNINLSNTRCGSNGFHRSTCCHSPKDAFSGEASNGSVQNVYASNDSNNNLGVSDNKMDSMTSV